MTGKTERVILLKGDATKWYDQAIFIVNQNAPPGKMPVDFVAEAERIINSYMAKEKRPPISNGAGGVATTPHLHSTAVKALPVKAPAKAKAKKGGFDFMLNLMMILACIAIVVVFLYGMMS